MKLDLRDRVQVVVLAYESGLIEPPHAENEIEPPHAESEIEPPHGGK